MIMPVGSPPRVRGKVQVCSGVVSEQRITPACAGKRFLESVHNRQKEDHPRVCGEKCFSRLAPLPAEGSPPRVRGKNSLQHPAPLCFGITPACAGKRRCCRCGQTRAWDHPRVCGEKPFRTPPGRGRWGSPPRVRGKDLQTFLHGHQPGITPACAGKSALQRRALRHDQDHPRVCGEKQNQHPSRALPPGSPPRVRGKECPMPDLRLGAGITPACAGKRVRADRQWHKDRDHPRVCGEKVSSAALMMIVAGSPPRVRGKAVAAYNSVAAEGITPACAGKSTLRKTAGSTYRDHPRVCGEKTKESLKK